MRIRKFAAAIALGAAAIAPVRLCHRIDTRSHALPGDAGAAGADLRRSFPVGGMAASGGLEFQRYAAIVAQQLAARGYTPAPDPASASMVVQLGYGVDHGQIRVRLRSVRTTVTAMAAFTGAASSIPGSAASARPSITAGPTPSGTATGSTSYVEYHSEVDLHIRAKGTQQPLFDGRAQARSQTNRLDVVLPSLIEALFTGFPGQNGETVKITIPTRPATTARR